MIIESVTIRRVGPTSALKFGTVIGLVYGVLYSILILIFPFSLLPGAIDPSVNFDSVRLVVLCMSLLGGAIGGGLAGLVMAWIYNLALRVTGGLRLEIWFDRDDEEDAIRKGGAPSLGSMMSNDE